MSLALLIVPLMSGWLQETSVFQIQQERSIHERTVLWQRAEDLHRLKPDDMPVWRRGGRHKVLTTPLPLAKAIIFCHLPWSSVVQYSSH